MNNISHNPYAVAMQLSQTRGKRLQLIFKKCADYFLTPLFILLLSPLLLGLAIAIKITSPGPIIFKQKRIGYLGKEFYMYKYRSMEPEAEKHLRVLKPYNETNELMFKMAKDPRLTKVGKFLRKYSLDELPQLINILRGEMSLVGFRPPLPEEVEKYEPSYYVRFAMMPGLTGPWQVGGRSSIKHFKDVIKLEQDYFQNWSLLKDLKILLKTIPVVLLGKDSA